jgi:hypothetical protein
MSACCAGRNFTFSTEAAAGAGPGRRIRFAGKGNAVAGESHRFGFFKLFSTFAFQDAAVSPSLPERTQGLAGTQ